MGGAENITITLIKNSSDFDHTILIFGGKSEYQHFCEIEHGIRFINLNWKRRGMLRIANWKSLFHAISKASPSLIQTYMYDASLYGRVVGFMLGIPVVMFVANTYNKKKYVRGIVNFILGFKTKKVIACSEDVKKDILRYDRLQTQKVVVIPSFTQLNYCEDRSKNIRSELGIQSDDYVGLFIARLVPQKGIELLINAVSTCVNERGLKDLKFIVVGDGPLKDNLLQLIKDQSLTNHFFMVGEKRELNPFLTEANFYVDSALFSGLSLAAIKALEAGLPMIMTDVGGAKMLLADGQYGSICQSGSTEVIAEKISLFCKQKPERNVKATAYVKENFSDIALSKKIIDIYREVVS
jgi:glycosyltransferase involved in cell wall biosynthesis